MVNGRVLPAWRLRAADLHQPRLAREGTCHGAAGRGYEADRLARAGDMINPDLVPSLAAARERPHRCEVAVVVAVATGPAVVGEVDLAGCLGGRSQRALVVLQVGHQVTLAEVDQVV